MLNRGSKAPPHWERLTFDGFNDLYLHPLYGSYTLDQIDELDELRRVSAAKAKEDKDTKFDKTPIEFRCSPELFSRNERFIDDHGFSNTLD